MTMEITPRDVRDIVASALGSLDNTVISHSVVSTSVLVGGKFVLAITPFPKQIRIQCITGLGASPRHTHLKQVRSSDERWETWVASTATGLASFVHQVAPALGRLSERVQPVLQTEEGREPEASAAEVPATTFDGGEEPIVQRALALSPGDVEEIAIRWQKAGATSAVASARAAAIRALPSTWAASKLRVLKALDVRSQALGDDLPWDLARAAALDALRAVLAGAAVTADDVVTLTEAWGEV
jgi:hypothetical protein